MLRHIEGSVCVPPANCLIVLKQRSGCINFHVFNPKALHHCLGRISSIGWVLNVEIFSNMINYLDLTINSFVVLRDSFLQEFTNIRDDPEDLFASRESLSELKKSTGSFV